VSVRAFTPPIHRHANREPPPYVGIVVHQRHRRPTGRNVSESPQTRTLTHIHNTQNQMLAVWPAGQRFWTDAWPTSVVQLKDLFFRCVRDTGDGTRNLWAGSQTPRLTPQTGRLMRSHPLPCSISPPPPPPPPPPTQPTYLNHAMSHSLCSGSERYIFNHRRINDWMVCRALGRRVDVGLEVWCCGAKWTHPRPPLTVDFSSKEEVIYARRFFRCQSVF